MNEMQIKRQKSAMIAATAVLGSLCKRSKMKNNSSNAVDAHWERDRDAVTSQRTPGGHSAIAMDLSLCLYSNSVRYLSASTELSRRFWRPCGADTGSHFGGFFFASSLNDTQSHGAYSVNAQSVRRRMTFYNAVALWRHSMRFNFLHLGFLYYMTFIAFSYM